MAADAEWQFDDLSELFHVGCAAQIADVMKPRRIRSLSKAIPQVTP
jgi:hypothetical protein